MTLGLTRPLARDCSENAERRIESAQKQVLTLLYKFLWFFYPPIRVIRMALDELNKGCGRRPGARVTVCARTPRDC